MIKKYNKLVRDRIPEIIEASEKKCVAEILSDVDYLRMVDAKLDEELAEYHKDQNIEELADLLEVIHGLYLPMDIRWRIWSVSVSKKQRNVVDSLKEFSLWEWRNHNGFRTS